MLVMMLVSLYTTRVVLNTLGIDDYGIYNVVGGVVVFFSFINSGLAGATKRYILAELAVGDIKSQRKVYSLAINAHLLIIALVLIAGETIGLWIFNNTLNIPESRLFAAKIVFHASIITAILGIILSPFSSVIIAYERMSVYAYLSIFEVLLKLGIVFLIQVIGGDKLILYAILICVLGVLNLFIYYIYCRKQFEICRYVKTKDKTTFFSILQYVGWTIFGSGANILSRQGVNILINNFFTVAVNAAMGICNMIVNAASQFVNNLQVAFAPQLTKNYISKDYSSLISLLFKSSRYTSYLILMILIPISFVISDLLKIWLGDYPEYTEEFCILTLICVYIEAVSMPMTTVITSDKKIQNYHLIVSAFYLLNFVLCWVVLLLGSLPYYVLIVRAVVDLGLVAVRLWLTKRKVEVFSITSWIKEVYIKSIVFAMLSMPLFVLYQCITIESTMLRFVIKGGSSFAWIVTTIFFMGLQFNEKSFVHEKIKSIKLFSKR